MSDIPRPSVEYANDVCDYQFKSGWWCSRDKNHEGQCALRPRWWNISKDALRYKGIL